MTQEAQLSKGLVAHYTFDNAQTSGGTLYDQSAYDNHGTINGSPTTGVSGQVGEAYELADANGDYITTPLADQSPEITITAWINLDQYGTNERSHSHIVRTNNTWMIVDTDTESLWSSHDNAGGKVDFISNSSINLNEWTFCAVTISESGTITHYVNGNTYTDTFSAPKVDSSGQFALATDGTAPDGGLDGEMDEIRIYNRALSTDELDQLYQQRSPRTRSNPLDKGLEGYWTFDDAQTSGSTLYDQSAFDRHGSIQGDPVTGVSGQVGETWTLDGTGDGVIATGYKGVTGTQERTFNAWIKTTVSGGDLAIATWGSESPNGAKYIIRTDGADELRVENAGGREYTNGAGITDGNWHMVTVVLPPGSNDVRDHDLYVDGELITNTDGANQSLDTGTDTDFAVGIDNVSSSFDGWDGEIDEARLYNRALSADEISALYNKR